MPEETIDKLEGQPCPMCLKKTLTLLETTKEIPFFGKVYIFSMHCSSCHYKKADLESAERKEPSKYVFEIEKEEDLKVRVVKSSSATIKLPRIMTISPGPASEGYITNVEGILNRVKDALEKAKESAEDKKDRITSINLIKTINKVLFGTKAIKLTLEDPSGNSAIISDKAVKSKLKK